jgi:hypothetical protein
MLILRTINGLISASHCRNSREKGYSCADLVDVYFMAEPHRFSRGHFVSVMPLGRQMHKSCVAMVERKRLVSNEALGRDAG